MLDCINKKKYFRDADFLIHEKNQISVKEVGKFAKKSWPQLMNLLKDSEYELIAYSHTPKKTDLHVVRAILPGLVPITFGYRREPLGMQRPQWVAQRFANQTINLEKLKPLPHPFP